MINPDSEGLRSNICKMIYIYSWGWTPDRIHMIYRSCLWGGESVFVIGEGAELFVPSPQHTLIQGNQHQHTIYSFPHVAEISTCNHMELEQRGDFIYG